MSKCRFGYIFSSEILGLKLTAVVRENGYGVLSGKCHISELTKNSKTNRKHVSYLFWLSLICHCSRSLCVQFEKPKRFVGSLCVSVDQCVSWHPQERSNQQKWDLIQPTNLLLLITDLSKLIKCNTVNSEYSKTCVKRPLSNRPQIGFQDQLSLNACR